MKKLSFFALQFCALTYMPCAVCSSAVPFQYAVTSTDYPTFVEDLEDIHHNEKYNFDYPKRIYFGGTEKQQEIMDTIVSSLYTGIIMTCQKIGNIPNEFSLLTQDKLLQYKWLPSALKFFSFNKAKKRFEYTQEGLKLSKILSIISHASLYNDSFKDRSNEIIASQTTPTTYPVLRFSNRVAFDEVGKFLYQRRMYVGGTTEQRAIMELIEHARLYSPLTSNEITKWDPQKTAMVTSLIGQYFFDEKGQETDSLKPVSPEYRSLARLIYGTTLLQDGNYDNAINLLKEFFGKDNNGNELLRTLPEDGQSIARAYYGLALHAKRSFSDAGNVLGKFFNKKAKEKSEELPIKLQNELRCVLANSIFKLDEKDYSYLMRILLPIFGVTEGKRAPLVNIFSFNKGIYSLARFYYGYALSIQKNFTDAMSVLSPFFNAGSDLLSDLPEKFQANAYIAYAYSLYSTNTLSNIIRNLHSNRSLLNLLSETNQSLAHFIASVNFYKMYKMKESQKYGTYFFDKAGKTTKNFKYLNSQRQTRIRVTYADTVYLLNPDHTSINKEMEIATILDPVFDRSAQSIFQSLPKEEQTIAIVLLLRNPIFSPKKKFAIVNPLFKTHSEIIFSAPPALHAKIRALYASVLQILGDVSEEANILSCFFNESGRHFYDTLKDEQDTQAVIRSAYGNSLYLTHDTKNAVTILTPLFDFKTGKMLLDCDGKIGAMARFCCSMALSAEKQPVKAFTLLKFFFNSDGTGTKLLSLIHPQFQAYARLKYGHLNFVQGNLDNVRDIFGEFFEPKERDKSGKEEDSSLTGHTDDQQLQSSDLSQENYGLITGAEALSMLDDHLAKEIMAIYLKSVVSEAKDKSGTPLILFDDSIIHSTIDLSVTAGQVKHRRK